MFNQGGASERYRPRNRVHIIKPRLFASWTEWRRKKRRGGRFMHHRNDGNSQNNEARKTAQLSSLLSCLQEMPDKSSNAISVY